MANRRHPINYGSAAIQLRRYRYRLWIRRLCEYGLLSRKAVTTQLSSGNIIRFKPAFMKRLGMRLGDELAFAHDGQNLVLRHVHSPLEIRLERMRSRL